MEGSDIKKMEEPMRFIILTITVLFLALNVSLAASPKKAMTPVEHGKYLTIIAGCNDCHTPKNFTEQGPVPDMSRELSGHPADAKLPDLPTGVIGPGKWMAITTDLTAWYGPWGVSFTRNLTPDMETGLGSWTEQMFINALRTGKHMGAPNGRPILPPMPWQMYAQMTDEDLKAVWAYLRTIKPIKNAIPEPIPPPAPPKQ
jgi:Cytochrome c